MLQDREIDRALAVDMHDVGLGGEAVGDLANVADRDRNSIVDAYGQGVEAIHGRGAGIELHVVRAIADTRRARGNDHIRRLQRRHNVIQGETFGS